jgi:hypothetical protein
MLNTEFKLAHIIQKGFTQHKELNPKLFDDTQTLHNHVRKKLIVIANDFIDSLHIDHNDFEDIVLIGSIVNYNWNPYSDVDLHVVYDFKEINDDINLVTEFFLAKKSEWNQDHDVKIYGYDVELYGQDANEHVESGGIYSVMKNEWIVKPEPEQYEVSEGSLIKKTKHFMRLIDDVLKLDGTDETKIRKLKAIKEKIKKYRKSGLEHGGEFSEENLVFKMLRRTGYMEKLSDSKHELEDKVMSLPEGLNLTKKVWTMNTLIPIKILESGKVMEWSIEDVLEEINRDHSGGWTDYTLEDWKEGWDNWVEGEFYSRHVDTPINEGLNLGKKTLSDYKSWFESLITKFTINKFGTTAILYELNGEILMRYLIPTNMLFVHHSNIWQVLEGKFQLRDTEIVELIKETMKKYFNMEVRPVIMWDKI